MYRQSTLKDVSKLFVIAVILSREIGVLSNSNESDVVIDGEKVSVKVENRVDVGEILVRHIVAFAC